MAATISSIPDRATHERLTVAQQQILRSELTARLLDQRNRASQATHALDNFVNTDSPLDREFARRTVAGLRAGVHQLEDALERLDDDRYGVCISCAQVIPFERLEAIPEVGHCVDCTRNG